MGYAIMKSQVFREAIRKVRLGRRVWMRESEGDTVTKEERFVYDGYLCVQRLDATQGNAVRTEFVWDPTEPVATRPLAMRAKNWGLNLFYSHDGNKNVSEVFYHAPQNGIAAHYDYAPFGAVTRTASATRVTNRDLISENPFRFSSEYHDDPLSLVYYNYRHYNPLDGRWLGRDFLDNMNADFNLYAFVNNSSITFFDFYGLSSSSYLLDYWLSDYQFSLDLASGKSFKLDVREEINEALIDLGEDVGASLLDDSSVFKKAKEIMNQAELIKRKGQAIRTIGSLCVSSSWFIKKWSMVVDMTYLLCENGKEKETQERYTKGRDNCFIAISDVSAVSKLAEEIALATEKLVKDINEDIRRYENEGH